MNLGLLWYVRLRFPSRSVDHGRRRWSGRTSMSSAMGDFAIERHGLIRPLRNSRRRRWSIHSTASVSDVASPIGGCPGQIEYWSTHKLSIPVPTARGHRVRNMEASGLLGFGSDTTPASIP